MSMTIDAEKLSALAKRVETTEKTVALFGNIIADHIKIIDEYPKKDLCASILSAETAVGGAVPNSGIDLKVMAPALTVKAFGVVGQDGDGTFLLDRLKKAGLDTAGVKSVPGALTSFSDVMTEKTGGHRTFFSYRGASDLADENLLPEGRFCDRFHLGYLLLLGAMDREDEECGTKAARLLRDLKKRGIKTSVDVVSETGDRYQKIVRPALPYVDDLVINEIEGGKIAGIDPYAGVTDVSGSENVGTFYRNLEQIARKQASFGVKEKVVLHAPEAGASLDVESGKWTVVPSLDLPAGYIQGTVGAGDAFLAGFLAARLSGEEEDELSLAFASLAAAANLSKKDSVSGMASATEIIKREIFGRKEKC